LKILKKLFFILLSLFNIVSICSCTSALLKFDVDTPAQTLTYAGAPPIDDQRPRFREIFCELINQSSEAQQRRIKCEDYLWRLNDEKQGDKLSQPLPMHDANKNYSCHRCFCGVLSENGKALRRRRGPSRKIRLQDRYHRC